MRTVRTVNAARVRKGLASAMAWLLSLAVFSLSSAPVHADSEKRAPKEPQGEAADATEPAPAKEEKARKKRARKEPLAQADTTPPADAAPAEPVQGPSPDASTEPVEAVQGPSPELPAEPSEEVPPPAEVPLEVAPPEEVVAPVEPPNHTASYVLWTASVVSLGIGTAYGVMALKAKKDFDDDPTNKRADKAHDRGIAADVGLGLGVILAATGLAFYFAKDGGAKDTTASAPQPVRADLSVAPYVGRSAGGGNLSVRF